jgi:predicted phosphodiesterase
MKFGIYGDIHGNLEALEAVLEDMQVQGVTHTACVGDIVGQYANPRECLEIVRALGSPLVKGNHDEQASKVEDLDNEELSTVRHKRADITEEQRGFLRTQPLQRQVNAFTLVHAGLDHPGRWDCIASVGKAEANFQAQQTDICFFGHTHIPHVFIRDTRVHQFFYKKIELQLRVKYFVNVGSVGEPRDGDWRAAYAIYDLAAHTVELRRLPFDLAKAQAKIRGAGWI